MSAFIDSQEGVYFDLEEQTYRAATGINISALKNINRSPAHYLAKLTEVRPEPTPRWYLAHSSTAPPSSPTSSAGASR